MPYKKLTVKKLFFKKYPYKIVCHVGGRMHLLRYFTIDELKLCYQKKEKDEFGRSLVNYTFYTFLCKLNPFINVIHYRISDSFVIDLYIEDEKTFGELTDKLSKWINAVYNPETTEEINFLIQEGSNKTLCNELPHKRYRYRLHLNFDTDIELRSNFLSWSTNYNEKIRIKNNTELWFKNSKKFYQFTPVVYIEDGPTLNMVTLFLGNAIRKVEEFILKESINTTL
jgi:hypothetical protein